MENRELTNSEVEEIIKHFLGDEYLQVVETSVGYTDILGLSSYLTEIENDHNLLINICICTFSFSDDELTPEEVAGYIQCKMEYVMPYAHVSKDTMTNNIVSLNFEWY